MGVESGFVVVGGGRGSTKRSQRGLVCRIRSGWRHSRSSDRERVVVFAAAKEENSTSSATSEGKSASMFPAPLPVSDIWEIDFYSRPVLGLDGKKLWELIITDKSGNFEHVESVPNSMVNSKELRSRVEKVIADSRVKPKILRFFRAQMQNMIKIALSGIEDVVVTPSRRTYSLLQLIEYRELNVYPNMVGKLLPRRAPDLIPPHRPTPPPPLKSVSLHEHLHDTSSAYTHTHTSVHNRGHWISTGTT